jgi:4-amino-4-deoxy-L-arabinose transferase-like glycosyltransferase
VSDPRKVSLRRRTHLGYAAAATVVLAVGAVNLLFRLQEAPVREWDEARHGVSAEEMLRSGRLMVTTYAGEPDYWNLKPPLGTWMIAASYRAVGPGIMGLRLPSVVSALVGVASVMVVAWPRFGPRIAIIAGAILATCFPYLLLHGGRTGDFDAPFTSTVLLAMACLLRLPGHPIHALGLGLAMSLAFLLKGFAIAPMAAAGGAYLVASGELKRVPRARWLALIVAALLPAGLWALARYQHDGTLFLTRMVEDDLLRRSARAVEGASSHPLYYIAFLLDRAAPWPAALLVVGAWLYLRARRQGAPLTPSPPTLLLIAWVVIPIAVFSASATKHHWYVNPVLPGLALLSAVAIGSLASGFGRSGRRVVGTLTLLALVFCQIRVTHYLLTRTTMNEDQRFLLSLRDLGPGSHVSGIRPWSQVERFLLQVVGGLTLTLDEHGSPSPQSEWVLVDRTAGPIRGTIVRESVHYRLVAVGSR